MIAVVLAATRGAPLAALLGACFETGAASPQVAAFARVRWIALTRDDPEALAAAMGYKSTVDELTFVLGPALVGLISTTGNPAMTLLVAAVLTLVFGSAFAAHPTAGATRRAVGGQLSPPGRAGTIMTLLVSANVIGVAVGAAAAGTVAEASGIHAAFAAPVAAAVALAGVGLLAGRSRTGSDRAKTLT